MKNKTTTVLLALFLGGIGAHRFYLGQTGFGILYLLFFWTFIPAFIALIDLIVILMMDEDAFNAKYNQGQVVGIGKGFNTADELEKLFSLKEKGVLTEQEFMARKAKLL